MFELLDDISELVYVADTDTYELFYINDSGKAAFGLEKLDGVKCYEALQQRDSPCEFCTNDCLEPGKVLTWQHYNPISGRHYLLKDRLVDWEGKSMRMEIAFDITAQATETQALKNALNAEQMLMHCVQQLHREPNLTGGITQMLRQLAEELDAERAYIFIISGGKLYNTYEWCATEVQAELDALQGIDSLFIARWLPYFERGECVITENIEDIRGRHPEEYNILAMQNIKSMVAAPLEHNGGLVGFLGVDNPAVEKIRHIAPLLNTLRYFLMSTMERAEDERKLTVLSFHDTLTGLYNRTRYMQDVASLKASGASLGVVFMDLNGLKEINDRRGHADGDTALVQCADELRQAFPSAELYRIGGDEFVVMERGLSRTEFDRKTAEFRADFEKSTPYQMAMGAQWSADASDAERMLMEADARMYEDKRHYYRSRTDAARCCSTEELESLSSDEPVIKEYNMLMSSMRVSVSKHLMRDDFHMVWANDCFYNMTGYTSEEFEALFHGSCSAYFATDPDEYVRLFSAVSGAFLAGKPGYEAVINAPRKDGGHIWISLVGTFTDELIDGCRVIYTVFTDVTELTQQRELMQRLAYVDPVTGGLNRTAFLREAGEAIADAPPRSYFLVTMDIQKFKVINDLFGTAAGDRTLFYLHRTIENRLGEGELIARLSTDLFVLLLKAGPRGALEDRLRDFAETANQYNLGSDVKYFLNLTFGVCLVDDPSLSVTTLQDYANAARKQAKAQIGAQVSACCFFSETDRLKLARETDIENRMRDALECGEFVVYLQPKQHLRTGKVVGAEALVRWKDPRYGLIPPGEFIPLFEKNGFIVDLDLYVFEQTCALLRRWLDRGLTPIPISVNMSRAHLLDACFLERYEAIRRRYEIDASLLEIELTETLVFESPELLSQIIDDIHACGYHCSMDDFGSGYSSLNVLKSIRVDTLKLDRAFFSSARVDSPWEAAVISVVVELARKLEMSTVAEGVETEAQADFLRTAGCDVLQGFLFSRPIPIPEFEALAFPTAALN